MRYEATINFEFNDEDVDIVGLIEAAHTIDVSEMELIGRTDDGEVALQMEMMSGGMVDSTPEKRVRIAETIKEIGRRLEVDEETANQLWERMAGVYASMADQGLCAYPGGEQSVRVIPEALEFIRGRAEAVPEED
jgi:hypothetical protein